jgi:small subunit ribosomal protein S6
MVTDYEVLIMFDPEAADARQSEVVERLKGIVEKGQGRWDGDQLWGKRKLAYEIRHKGEGVYHLVTFAADAESLEEVSRVLRIDDSVMRHMAVKRVKGASTAAPAPAAVDAAPEPEPVLDAE